VERGPKKRSAVKSVAAIAVVIILVLLLLTPAVQGFLKDLIQSPFQPRYPESATFELERKMTVDANGGEVLNYTFDISEPITISQNGYTIQNVSSISYDPAVTTKDVRYGHNWVTWYGAPFSGQQTRTCTATYDVTVYTHIWNIDKANSLNVSDVPSALRATYLHDEWKMNMTSPAIVTASSSIVGNETNVYQILRDIYVWMTENVRYPTGTSGGEPQDAVVTLESRVGDCDDQSILFCSLARAAGVPAWLQMGALYVSAENSWGGHGWLQAYVPLRTGGGENVTIDVVNKDFLVFRPNRFVDFTDDGDGSHLSDYYYTFFTTYRGASPLYSEEYVKISYEESGKKISQGAVYELADLMQVGTVRVPTRR
jgi:Transglutaminase-like superfamily